MIETQMELKDDAIKRGFRPEAVCIRLDGAEVLVTSWPWWEGEGEDRTARIMARTDRYDCRTNHEMPYFSLMKRIGEQSLETV